MNEEKVLADELHKPARKNYTNSIVFNSISLFKARHSSTVNFLFGFVVIEI